MRQLRLPDGGGGPGDAGNGPRGRSQCAPPAKSFFDAVQAGNVSEAGTVLAAHPELLRFRFGPEGTALHVAARCNKPEMIAFLLDKGADIKSRGQWDGTPLHWAAWWGAKSAADVLLKRGTPVDVRGDQFGSTPLFWAAHGSANLQPRRHLPGDR